MSRVGKQPILIPEAVKVTILADRLQAESSKGKLESPLYPGISARLEKQTLLLMRTDDSKEQRALHGLCRSLAYNAIVGLSTGFRKDLEIVGVGYRAKVDKDVLELNLGYSKPIHYRIPAGIQIVTEKPTLITVKGINKQQVGQVAEDIRRFRKPDPYKLKGIRYVGEVLIKKERKAGVSGA